VDLARVSAPAGETVIDGMGTGFERSLRLLSTAGLADAFLLLRRPGELSDGQRWRLRLAHALAALVPEEVERPGGGGGGAGALRVLVADEMASTLDRLCARAVAYRLRRTATRHGVTVLAASAHEDVVEDLAPDVLVVKEAGSEVEVFYADGSRGEGAR